MNLLRERSVYRYTAILLILILAFYIALNIRKYGKDKIIFHIDIIDFITYVKQQITFFCTPTNKILEEYSDSKLYRSGIFEDGGVDANIYLDERGKKLLKDYFSKFGKSSAEDQISNCDYTIEQMNDLLNEYKEEIPKKYKAYSTLAFVVSSMLIILLL